MTGVVGVVGGSWAGSGVGTAAVLVWPMGWAGVAGTADGVVTGGADAGERFDADVAMKKLPTIGNEPDIAATELFDVSHAATSLAAFKPKLTILPTERLLVISITSHIVRV